MTQPTVLCVGRLYCDLIFTEVPRMPTLGTETFAGGFGIHAGGGAYITAAWLASLGCDAKLASFLPPPPFRDQLAGEIKDSGVDISLSSASPADQTPQLTVAIAAGGDRAFLTHRQGPPFPKVTDVDVAASGAAHVHIGEASTLIESPEILKIARSVGATVSLDCGWEDDLAIASLKDLLPSVDVFLPNAMEAKHLQRNGISLSGPQVTVTKRGPEGASAVANGTDYYVPARRVAAVDTTGAGDAFNAGFLSAWLEGRGLADCLQAGNAVGAKAVARRGGYAVSGDNVVGAEAVVS